MVTTRPPKMIVKPTALGPVANTDTKLLVYGLFQKGRVLAQDGIVSSLGISFMDMESVDALFRPLLPHLGKKGTITQFQYVTAAWGSMAGVFSISMRAVMKRYFCCVQSTSVWLNLPPAFVITGHGERTAAEAVVSENANGAGSGYQQMSD